MSLGAKLKTMKSILQKIKLPIKYVPEEQTITDASGRLMIEASFSKVKNDGIGYHYDELYKLIVDALNEKLKSIQP